MPFKKLWNIDNIFCFAIFLIFTTWLWYVVFIGGWVSSWVSSALVHIIFVTMHTTTFHVTWLNFIHSFLNIKSKTLPWDFKLSINTEPRKFIPRNLLKNKIAQTRNFLPAKVSSIKILEEFSISQVFHQNYSKKEKYLHNFG